VAELEFIVTNARVDARQWERTAVTEEIYRLPASSGLTDTDFAADLGVPSLEFALYKTGRFEPAAGLMVRMRDAARRGRQERAAAGD
jgi:hypothetical protein